MKKLKEKAGKLIYLKPLMILLLVFIPYIVGFWAGNKFLLPFLTSVPATIILINHLRKGRLNIAILDMILYVFWLSVIGISLTYIYFDYAGDYTILNGRNYVEEMRPWLEGEISKEGTPALFIKEHLLHMVVVALSSIISAGFLALYFGTILVNYMNFYVVWLMKSSGNPVLMSIIGWHPWSVIRVIAFIILGSVCACPLAAKFFKGEKIDRRILYAMLVLAVVLEILDIIIKATIGPFWRELLNANISNSLP